MADGVRVEGADALARGLQRFEAESKKEIRKSNLQVSRKARDWARDEARSGTRLQARMARGIGAFGNSKQAGITVRNTAGAPGATVAFYGAKRRTGWYAAPRYRSSPTPQFPRWVGTNWRPAQRGQGPYAINDMLDTRLAELRRLYAAGQIQALRRVT